jgi:hypothetical protein
MLIPAYTFRPSDVILERVKTQRFTMRDIGKLQDRIENIEFSTALSLLERDAESFEIQDENGLNRFKSGFVVDNFAGHRLGKTIDKDYKCAIDMVEKELRPKCILKNASLLEVATTDSARTTAGYQKTGDLITLPYTHTNLAEQPYATKTENVQPYLLASFVGKIELSPSGDEWFETETAPAVIVNREGNFDSIEAANRNAIGTVWNAWETTWSGITQVDNFEERIHAGIVRRFINVGATSRTDQNRTGLRTRVVENVTEEVVNSRTISRALIPFVRPRNVTFTGSGFQPNTRLYGFFDGVPVTIYITPTTGFSSDTTIVAGSPLITSSSGAISGTFSIPDHRFPGQENNPRFRTGEVAFRLSSSETNVLKPSPKTQGNAVYYAQGILNTNQDTIVATRNGILVQDNVEETTSESFRTTVRRAQWYDPLAQTFLVTEEGGAFVTKVDLYFGQKDDTLPVEVEIREVINGYPGPKIMPFARVVKNPADINVSQTAATATTFTFPSPVFLKQAEYCVVVMTASLHYRLWISEMGQVDVGGGNRLVSRQPYLGVLFKSQNNSTWNAIQAEDMKFTLYRADFTTNSTGTLALTNDSIGDETIAEDGSTEVYGRRLQRNPLVLTNSSTVMQVKHEDHGMYSTSNNVTITGAKSGIETTLDGAITATATSLTLTSATGFEASSLSSRIYVKIGNEIMFGTLSSSTIGSLTRGDDGTTASAHADDATIELYQILKTPLTEINKTHTALANIGMDSYTVTLTTAPTISGGSTDAEVGDISVFASENYRMELLKTQISALELPDTTLTSNVKTTSGTSPAGSESSFSTATTSTVIPLNENFKFDTSRIIASDINQTNELGGAKSFFLDIGLRTTKSNVSPVIDFDRLSVIAVGNRINNVDSSSDVFPTTDFVASTEPEGDQNAFIYITKRIPPETPATALKVFFAGHKHSSAEIKVLFKILRSDSADDFDELGYDFFNTTGTTDVTTASSLDEGDFQQYLYTAGVTDDGIGESLPEFIQFAIKIVGQGTNAAEPIRIKDLRVIALAT